MSLFLVRLTHTLVFVLLGGCVLHILFCAVTNRFSRRTVAAILLIVAEGIVLLVNDWECPLTTLARRLGASDGQVADIFLPRWFAAHLFELCTPLFIGSSILLLIRRLRGRKTRRM